MRIFQIKENVLTEESKKWFERMNPGMEATGDILVMGDEHSSIEHPTFKGCFTPYDCVRDCGDHWIHAGYESYDRIDKVTYKFTKDYGDK